VTKVKILKIINTVLFVLMIVQAFTGLAQRYFGENLFIFFRRVHFLNGMILLLFFVLHLKFNWGWIRTNVLKSFSKS